MKAAMHRYLAWLGKEWRDQRAILLGIILAVPSLTALAYYTFGDHLATSNLRSIQMTFLAVSIGLVVFAVAGDLFAGENRRKTIHALRRLPGGMGSAFAAKLTLLVLALVIVVGVQGLSLAVAEHQNQGELEAQGLAPGHPSYQRATWMMEGLASFPTSEFWLLAMAFGVFGLWTLLVSSWMGRSGVAGIGAAVLLAGVAAPFVLLFKENPWFFPGPKLLASWTIGLTALVALIATSVSFLRGQRFAGRPFRPFLLGAALVLVATGGGYAYARQQLNAWVTFGPDVENLRIHQASIGADGRYLFLTVARGALWDGSKNVSHHTGPSDPWRARRGTQAQGWVVDLEEGTWRPVDDRKARYFLEVPEVDTLRAYASLDPVEALVCYQLEDPKNPTLGWYDARTGEKGKPMPFLVRDADALDLARRQLARDTWLRDDEGRRIWLRDGVIEHEGQTFERPTNLVARPETRKSFFMARRVPGGWFGRTSQKSGHMIPTVLDAATGEYKIARRLKNRSGYWHSNVLSTDHMLLRETVVEPREGQLPLRTLHWRVMSFDDPERLVPVKNEPELIGTVLAKDLVFATRGKEHAQTLHLWNPRTGADQPLRWAGEAPEGISAAGVAGRTGDGRALIQLWRRGPGRGSVGEHGYAVLNADLTTLRMVVPFAWRHTGLSGGKGNGYAPVALLPDDSLVVLAHGRAVIRVRPGGASETLFPQQK